MALSLVIAKRQSVAALVEYQIPPDIGINYVSDDSEEEVETMETEEEM
jgi:hypothetical protein